MALDPFKAVITELNQNRCLNVFNLLKMCKKIKYVHHAKQQMTKPVGVIVLITCCTF